MSLLESSLFGRRRSSFHSEPEVLGFVLPDSLNFPCTSYAHPCHLPPGAQLDLIEFLAETIPRDDQIAHLLFNAVVGVIK